MISEEIASIITLWIIVIYFTVSSIILVIDNIKNKAYINITILIILNIFVIAVSVYATIIPLK